LRLTTFTDYSLRVLIYVAHAPEGRATIAEVARAFDVSEHHLVKVVHALGRMGALRNSRGRGGGLRLAGPPSGINVGKVVLETESIAVAECFDAEHNTCALAGRCRLEGILHEAVDAFHAVLDRYTLQDLLPPPRPAHSFLPWPNNPAAHRAA
jgi:Rrf2 family transcriptional regulator, nitric oxide-sensitive transcriptional repressor